MTNAELIKALRYCGNSRKTGCKGCPLWDKPMDACFQIVTAAADALEAADRLLDQNTKRCEALRKQLRDSHESYEKHINELEAQMPKEGEWIKHGCEEDEFTYWECPFCGFIGLEYHYCPNCGASMRK